MNNNENSLCLAVHNDCQVQHVLKQESTDDTLPVRAQASEKGVTVKSSLRQKVVDFASGMHCYVWTVLFVSRNT